MAGRPPDFTPLTAIAELREQVDSLNTQLASLRRELAQRDALIIAGYEGFTKAATNLADAVAERCLESDTYSVQARELLRNVLAEQQQLPAKMASAVALAVGAALASASSQANT